MRKPSKTTTTGDSAINTGGVAADLEGVMDKTSANAVDDRFEANFISCQPSW